MDTPSFDPLKSWLGIPEKDLPPDHYCLLGLDRFESDRRVIEQRVHERLRLVKSYRRGTTQAKHCDALDYRISVARACLLSPPLKTAYDRQLRMRLEGKPDEDGPDAAAARADGPALALAGHANGNGRGSAVMEESIGGFIERPSIVPPRARTASPAAKELHVARDGEPARQRVAPMRRAAGPWREESPHRYGRSESSGQLLSWLAWLGGAAVAIAGLLCLASWLFSASALPQTRFLPERCDWFASICWRKAADGRLADAAPGAELRALVQRCTIFLRNANLQAADVDSISAGRAADRGGIVVVYHLSHPIECQKIMDCPAFGEIGKSAEDKETIGGAAVFLLAASAIAFPDSQTIVSGEKGLVREVLGCRRSALGGPLEKLVRGLDFSVAAATAAVGAPKALMDAHLGRRGELAAAAVGTTEEIRDGSEWEIVRTLRFDSPAAADDFGKTLRASIADAASASGAADGVHTAFSKLEISSAEDRVVLKLRLPSGFDSASLRETIDSLF